MPGDFVGYQNQGLLLSSGMLLNILQSAGRFPTGKNYPDENINSAEVEKT